MTPHSQKKEDPISSLAKSVSDRQCSVGKVRTRTIKLSLYQNKMLVVKCMSYQHNLFVGKIPIFAIRRDGVFFTKGGRKSGDSLIKRIKIFCKSLENAKWGEVHLNCFQRDQNCHFCLDSGRPKEHGSVDYEISVPRDSSPRYITK